MNVVLLCLSASVAVAEVSPNNGPATGGNTLLVTGIGLGNADITNVTICGITANINSQSTNSVTLVAGGGGEGPGDIVVRSISRGATTLTNAYTYNTAGMICGALTGWTSVSNLPAVRMNLAAASLTGTVFAIGGVNQDDSYSNREVYKYDVAQPAQGWKASTNLPENRAYLAAASACNKLYAIGGWGAYGLISSVFRFDSAQGWTSVTNLPEPRGYLAAASVGGKVYAIGGEDPPLNSLGVVYRYDPAQPGQGWTSVSDLPDYRRNLGAASVNGKLYAIGGIDYWGYPQTTAWVYDPLYPEAGWSAINDTPSCACAVSGINGKVYAISGMNGSSVYKYDPLQPELGWVSEASLPVERYGLALTSAGGSLFVMGGRNAGGTVYSTVYKSVFAAGVSPIEGPSGGGNTVTISGSNLGAGDVTNVTLCGVRATVVTDNSPTQVVVTVGAGGAGTNGDVVVMSTRYGKTVVRNVYTYLSPPPPTLPATNITLNSFYANWTSLAGATNYLLDVAGTNTFSLCVPGYSNCLVGNIVTYRVRGLDSGTPYWYRVRAVKNGLAGENSSAMNVQTLIASLSLNNGPAAGSNLVTISGAGLGSGGTDITNVTMCGVKAAIQSQATNSVTVLVGPGGSGTGDVVVYSKIKEVTRIVGAYRYNPPGVIGLAHWGNGGNLPVESAFVAAAAANGRIFSLGGESWDSYLSNVYAYDPQHPEQGWTSVSSLPAPRSMLAAVSVNGMVYAIGGWDGSACQSSVYVYDSAHPEGGWKTTSSLPGLRGFLSAATVDGKIYAIGGFDGYAYQSTVFCYDTTQPWVGWTSVSNLPAPRAHLAAASAGGKLYAIGGWDGDGCQSSVFRYDPAQPVQGWISVSNLPAARAYLTAANPAGQIMAIGGYGEGAEQSSVYLYDPAQPSLGWSSLEGQPVPLRNMAAVSLNGRVYMFGGFSASLSYASQYYEAYNAAAVVYEWDGTGGVVPRLGPQAGGQTVTLNGSNFGNGGDITNVTLCGYPVSAILSQSASQVVVRTGLSAAAVTGDVRICSISYGLTTKGKAYTYTDAVVTNGVPEWWLRQYFPVDNDLRLLALSDTDGDGASTLDEYGAGTDPSRSDSVLAMSRSTNGVWAGSNGFMVSWWSVAGKRYTLQRATNLVTGFNWNVKTNIAAIAPMNTETDKTVTGTGPWFYRIRVE